MPLKCASLQIQNDFRDFAALVDLQLLLTWLVSGWSRGFGIGFSPGLSADATLQNLLRQDDHRVSARMGIPYFSVVEHFPLHPREIWARD
ncbi:hypothetical protein D4764_04G0015030, partial [Takifugu flavidus]